MLIKALSNITMKFLYSELVNELNVSPAGSRVGVVDGNSGTVVISPNWTDVSSVLACNIMSIPTRKRYTYNFKYYL